MRTLHRFFPLLVPLFASAVFAAGTKPPQKATDPKSDQPPAHLTEVWTPVPPVVTFSSKGVPSDAVVLFDGKNLEAWESEKNPGSPARWTLEGDAMIPVPKSGAIQTKASFGDIQLHLEFRTPTVLEGTGQGRGNSGVFFMGKYELQVLDSHENPTYVNGQAASIYKQHAPLVNASRKPGEWQSYDAFWTAPRFDEHGKVISPARLTVLHNGVLVQHETVLKGPTVFRGEPKYQQHADKLPLSLQDHTDLVAFRNIWVRELNDSARK